MGEFWGVIFRNKLVLGWDWSILMVIKSLVNFIGLFL